MTESENICPICLRTNRSLKVIHSTLSVYHDELTDYTLLLNNPRYCSECECLLRKTYNFHRKCKKAAKILQKWMKTSTMDKTLATKLYLKLPPINLDIWTQGNNKTFKYTYPEIIATTNMIEESNPEKLNIDTMKAEELENKVQSETIYKMKLKHEQPSPYQIVGFQNFNNGSDDTINVFQNILTQQNSDENFINHNNISRNVTIESNKIAGQDMGLQVNYTTSSGKADVQGTAQTPYIMLDIDDIKHTIQNQTSALKLTHDPHNKSCIDNDVDMKHISHDDYNNMFEIDDEDMMMIYPDESLNSSDNCDDDLFSPNSNDQEVKEINSYYNKECINNIISQLERMDKTLDSICKNWEMTTLKDVGSLAKDKIRTLSQAFLAKKRIRRGKEKRKTVKGKLQLIASDLDLLNEICVDSLKDYKMGLCTPKERLKEKLERVLTITQHGLKKNVILSCLDKVSDLFVLRLLNLMHGTTNLDPAAVKLLKIIQDIDQFTQYESVFDIEFLLTKKDKLEEFQRRKTYECYVKSEYKCTICYQGFKSLGLLQYHSKCHDENKRKFSCSICNVRNYTRRDYRKHTLLHQEVFKCKLCPLVTYYRNSMVNHFEQHSGKIYKCDKCNNTYKSKSCFAYHQSYAHPRGVHVCSICGKSFVSQLGLNGHALRIHQGATPVSADGSSYNCGECTLTFPSEEACLRHRKLSHRVFTRSRRVLEKCKRPVLTKPRKKPTMTCPECGAEGHSYEWMVKHFRSEHPSLDVATVYGRKQNYLCDICGKTFLCKSYLDQHISAHSGIKFPCPTCKKQFASQVQLRLHKVRHGPRGYCCERCGKKFHSWSNLYNHIRIHIGDRRFRCHICDKGFLHSYSLTEHIRGVHNHQRRIRKRGATNTRGVTDTSHRVTGTSHGVTATSHGVTDASHGITGNSHGVTGASYEVDDAEVIKITIIGAEVV